MKGCWIDTYYVKRDEPYTKYKDTFHLSPYNEFTQRGPNTWKAHYGQYIITIVQKHQHHDIEEKDVIFEKNPSYKEDSNILHAVPSKEAIAQKLNEHLNKIYD